MGCAGFNAGLHPENAPHVPGTGVPILTSPVDYLGWIAGVVVAAAGGVGCTHYVRKRKLAKDGAK